MRFSALDAIVLLLEACNRLSPNERRVVGTWVVHTIDSHDYTIVRPNHIYEEVSNFGNEELTLLCLGHWHIEGEDIVTECSLPVRPGLEKEIHNPTYSKRLRIDVFLNGLEPHAPISYKLPYKSP
jgi:hypothetical protein